MVDRLIVLLPGVVMLLYIATAFAFLVKKQPSWALVYFAYSLANVGLVWASIKS